MDWKSLLLFLCVYLGAAPTLVLFILNWESIPVIGDRYLELIL